MTHEQKKAIYDSVMQKFSIVVKNKLNEALDYKAENGDGASDWRAEYFEDAVDLLKDKVKKLKKAEKEAKNKKWYNHGGWCYTIIGLVNPVVKMMIDTHNDWYIDDELLDILDEAIQGVKDDKEFHEGWDDVKELEKNIKEYEKQLEDYRKHIKELHDN